MLWARPPSSATANRRASSRPKGATSAGTITVACLEPFGLPSPGVIDVDGQVQVSLEPNTVARLCRIRDWLERWPNEADMEAALYGGAWWDVDDLARRREQGAAWYARQAGPSASSASWPPPR